VTDPPNLHDELLASAKRFASSALQGFLDGDVAIFLLHAGTALEQLTKSYLAEIDPSLIAGTDFDSLLHVRGLSKHATRSRLRMKTISLREALDRAGQLVPTIPPLASDLGLLVDVRNGVAHMGRAEPGTVEVVFVPFLKACEELLANMNVEQVRSNFWGDYTPMVETRLSDSAQEAEVRASEAITAARLVFEGRFRGMGQDFRDSAVRFLEQQYVLTDYEEDLVKCPSCGYLALASGTSDVTWDADWDYEDGVSTLVGATPTVRLVPYRLDCRICGLELDGADELAAADIEQSWELEDVDPAHFEADFEDLYE
jgi:hypothetical protein